jgi:nucleotide-binding universal stress UspA family protein
MQPGYSMTTDNQVAAWRPAKVMVATDLSPVSERAVNYAAALSRHFDAQFYLAHVLTETTSAVSSEQQISASRASHEDAERKISEILNSEALRDTRHTVLLEEGFLWQTLETLIRKNEINLVVAGTHGRKEYKGEFTGSWAELIFRHAECPVITVGPGWEGSRSSEVNIAKILFATDFGRASQHAAPYACSMAREFKAVLSLLHVIEGGPHNSDPGWATTLETTRVQLAEALPEGIEKQLAVEYVIRSGDSAQEIVQVARLQNADLIVMGARLGQKLVTHLPEPAAYTVAAEAPCPVLTVKAY